METFKKNLIPVIIAICYISIATGIFNLLTNGYDLLKVASNDYELYLVQSAANPILTLGGVSLLVFGSLLIAILTLEILYFFLKNKKTKYILKLTSIALQLLLILSVIIITIIFCVKIDIFNKAQYSYYSNYNDTFHTLFRYNETTRTRMYALLLQQLSLSATILVPIAIIFGINLAFIIKEIKEKKQLLQENAIDNEIEIE